MTKKYGSRKKLPFVGTLADDSRKAITDLDSGRKVRRDITIAGAFGGFGSGGFGISFKGPVREATLRTVTATIGGLFGFTYASKTYVKDATLKVGKALAKEIGTNIGLKRFLESYKYIYLDRKGHIIGTNKNRKLKLFGRFRLESKKILDGKY